MDVVGYCLKLSVVFVFLSLFTQTGFAQISDGSTPASFQSNLKAAVAVPQHELDSVFADQMIALDEKEGIDNRYGVVDSMQTDIRESGVYAQIGGMNVWRYEISCPDAFSLGVMFSTFDVPEGAALYIYSPDKSRVRGAFTQINKKEDGQFTLADFKGNSLIVEYDEPVSPAYEGGVVIGAVVKAYQDFASVDRTRIQINCPEGDDWQIQKHAVCMITFSDSRYAYYCSGSLVNNVREDSTPYFLTANHCISTSAEAGTLVAYFNYEMSGCETNDAALDQSVSGSTLMATNSYSDFTLLKLSEDPLESYEPYFAGWDATGGSSTTGTSIHHPQGSSKCIALDYDPTVSVNYAVQWDDGSTSQANSHWEVAYDAGVDESGSSGGPLFNDSKRIIGQLHGGDDDYSLFGKFSLSWDYRSEITRQLKNWLDPDNTGVVQMDGLEGFTKPVAAFSTDATIVCLNSTLVFTDESKYTPESWNWVLSPSSYIFVNGTSASSQNPEVQFLSEGVYSVYLTVTNQNGSDELLDQDLISAYSTLPVKWTGLADETTMCGWELDGYEFIAEGASIYTYEISASEKFSISSSDNILVVNLSDEAKEEGSFDTYVKVTGSSGDCESADSVLIHVIIPENDNVAQAMSLKLGYNGTYSNLCGTVEDEEPAPSTEGCSVENNWCPPNSTEVLDNSIWFRFEGPSSGFVTIETEGIDSQIAVYRTATAENLLSGSTASYTMPAASDMGTDGAGAAVIENMSVTPGAAYWLQVDGTDGAEGDINIRLLTNSVEVYPNPSTGLYHLTIASVTDGDAELTVYSQLGQLIYAGTGTFNQQANTIDFNLSGNPAGIYYFRTIINGEVMSKKLILVH